MPPHRQSGTWLLPDRVDASRSTKVNAGWITYEPGGRGFVILRARQISFVLTARRRAQHAHVHAEDVLPSAVMRTLSLYTRAIMSSTLEEKRETGNCCSMVAIHQVDGRRFSSMSLTTTRQKNLC